MSQGARTASLAGWPRWAVLAFWLAVVAAVGVAGSWVTLPKIPGWYAGLAKPSFTPPNAVFGPVWTVLYVMMAVAVWRAAGAAPLPMRRVAVALFCVQLGLNALWSPAFFGLEAPRLGLAVIAALSIALVATVVVVTPPSGALVVGVPGAVVVTEEASLAMAKAKLPVPAGCN